MGPIEEPFGYSKQQRPAGTLSTVSASPAIIYSCWRPSLVTMAKLSIHSGYLPGKRPPPGAGTRLLHRLRIQLAFHHATRQSKTTNTHTSLHPLCPLHPPTPHLHPPLRELYTSLLCLLRLTAYAQHRRSVLLLRELLCATRDCSQSLAKRPRSSAALPNDRPLCRSFSSPSPVLPFKPSLPALRDRLLCSQSTVPCFVFVVGLLSAREPGGELFFFSFFFFWLPQVDSSRRLLSLGIFFEDEHRGKYCATRYQR